MGHHIDAKGRFQSDKYPELGPDKIVLSFRDKAARLALYVFASETQDRELGEDVRRRLDALADEVFADDSEAECATRCGPRHEVSGC